MHGDWRATADGLAVVRIEDGRWWKLTPNIVPYAAEPLDVTRDHVRYGRANQVLRIRLDSSPPEGIA